MRKLWAPVLIALALLAACGGNGGGTAASTTLTAARTTRPAARTTTTVDHTSLAGTAELTVAGDPRADRDGDYEFEATEVVSCSDEGGEGIRVNLTNEDAKDGQPRQVIVEGNLGDETRVLIDFQSEDGVGTTYDSTFASSSGKQGSASYSSATESGTITVAFDMQSSDNARITGTITCGRE